MDTLHRSMSDSWISALEQDYENTLFTVNTIASLLADSDKEDIKKQARLDTCNALEQQVDLPMELFDPAFLESLASFVHGDTFPELTSSDLSICVTNGLQSLPPTPVCGTPNSTTTEWEEQTLQTSTLPSADNPDDWTIYSGIQSLPPTNMAEWYTPSETEKDTPSTAKRHHYA